MSIIYRRTSIFDSSAQTLVNTVNCVGVMGKGLAKEFKSREPGMFRAYREICYRGDLRPGLLWLWRGKTSWVLNFPTKIHWRNPSKIEWIEAGLQKFVANYKSLDISEVSFPRLGCGNGDLDWNEVRPLMEKYLGDLSIPVFIHDFSRDIGLPEHLEQVTSVMKSENWNASSFGDFVAALGRSLELSEGAAYDLQSGTDFKAVVAENRLGVIGPDKCVWLEEDDLRGIWLGLQTGLVTSRQAGWAVVGVGDQVVSLMSVLPYLRPVEIQKPDGRPEIAVERKFVSPTILGPASKKSFKQQELEWH